MLTLRDGLRRRSSTSRGHVARKRTFSPSRWSWLRYATSTHRGFAICRPSLRPNTGFHWRGSILWSTPRCGFIGHISREATCTTNSPKSYEQAVDIDGTLLESGSSFAPRDVRGVEIFAWLVSFALFPITMHSFTQSCEVTSLPTISSKECRSYRTRKRMNTLNLPSQLYWVITQVMRHHYQSAKVIAQGKMKAEAHTRRVALK